MGLIGTILRIAAWCASIALMGAALVAFLWNGESLPLPQAGVLLLALLWAGHLLSGLLLRLSDAEEDIEPGPVYARLHRAAVSLPQRPRPAPARVMDASMLPPWMHVEEPQERGAAAWRIAPAPRDLAA